MTIQARRADWISAETRVTRGTVATPHPIAAQAGLTALTAGGTAVDAAVAAAFALTVVTPASVGLAGYGGCMIMYLADQRRVVTLDFNCRAPAAASEDMFDVQESSNGKFSVTGAANAFGGLSVGVPGVLAGLVWVHERFGTIPLDAVIMPSVAAARDGFPVDAWTVAKCAEMLTPNAGAYPDIVRLFSVNGRLPREGEILSNPDLATTLERVAKDGTTVFYHGEIAQLIVETVERHGGIMTRDDLAAYMLQESRPVSIHYRGYELLTPSLCTGGLTVLQMLRVLDGLDVPPASASPEATHLLAEVAKVCWRERLMKYGDPLYVSLDTDEELGDRLVPSLRDEVVSSLPSPRPGAIIAPDPIATGTVHLCAADDRGNVVSLTQTHGGSFGSLLTVPGTGLVLGHGMSRFDPRPGRPNSIGPGKQPLHNMWFIRQNRGTRP